MKNDITDILFKYTTGEATLEETNEALKEAEAGFHLEPGKNEITPEEAAQTVTGETPEEVTGYGLLDTGTGSIGGHETMEEIKKDTAQKSQTEELKEKYGKVYRVGATIEVDDETEKNVEFFFKRPSTASYDRYVKTTAQGATKALKVFLFDNVVEESRASLEANLEEFPALALSIGEKLLGMLGLSKQTNLKML